MNCSIVSYKKWLTVIFAFLVVWCFLCYGFLIRPQMQTLRDLTTELSTKSISEDQLESISALNGSLAGYNNGGALRGRVLLSSREIPGFINDLNQECGRLNIELSNVALSPAVVPPPPPIPEGKEKEEIEPGPVICTIPVEITVRGDFKQAFELIRQLENYNRLITISDVKAKPAQDGYPSLEITLNVNLYIQETQGS